MVEPSTLKILGIALGLLGTGILSFRVTKILSALSEAVRIHDLNFQVQLARAEGRRDVPYVQMYGIDAHIDIAEKAGIKLLLLGFFLQISGGICNGIALLLQ